jgi:hypothetical protein
MPDDQDPVVPGADPKLRRQNGVRHRQLDFDFADPQINDQPRATIQCAA